ncbi:hypothetical protein Srot_0339 [Segniliparus rotundus DSM 44985]|uniref:Uncharacterized protein n=1 Tax=Segniliparus rotundus (strain ATCC BAA-972 / CDC 1076 / CIP 108378 / DSM 44985 / JCM 13578) TaxID=640132 RepID=D6ZB67_SEGRD|nr:hypothetical protein [Segniliparus rotundus]ADG96826.1 hypothetical protein Srot_0339 [Segniliparus rotundus DSM 44985]
MSEQKDATRKRPFVEESPSWRFPKITAQTPKEEPKRRVPATLFGGRLRTSTFALLLLYVILDVSKKPIPTAQSPAQPWAPPTNAVFGSDGNWTVPAQVPTSQQYQYRPTQPTSTRRPETTETSTPTTSPTPSGSESTSGSPNSSDSPDGPEPRHSRPRGQDDSSTSTAPSATGSATTPADSRPSGSAEPRPNQTRSRTASGEEGHSSGSSSARP